MKRKMSVLKCDVYALRVRVRLQFPHSVDTLAGQDANRTKSRMHRQSLKTLSMHAESRTHSVRNDCNL